MGPEQQRVRVPGGDEEGVLHVAGRVVRREVQRFEDMPVVLHLRAFGDIVADLAENVDDFLADDGNRMPGAEFHRVGGHGQVVPGRRGGGRRADAFLQRLDALGRLLLEQVELLAELALHLGRDRPEFFKKAGHGTLLSEEMDAGFLNFLFGRTLEGFQLCKNLLNGFFHNRCLLWGAKIAIIFVYWLSRKRPVLWQRACRGLSFPWLRPT